MMRRERRHNRASGFSIVEIIVASTVMAVLVYVFSPFSSSTFDSWETSISQKGLDAESVLAMHRVTEELRAATRTPAATPPSAIIPAPGETGNATMQFYLPAINAGTNLIIDAAGNTEWATGNALQYRVNAATNQLERVDAGGTVQVRGNFVTSAQFDDQSTIGTLGHDEVRVQLNFQRTTPAGRVLTASLASVVQLRN